MREPVRLWCLMTVALIGCGAPAVPGTAPEPGSPASGSAGTGSDHPAGLSARVDGFLAPYVEEGFWSGAVIVVEGDSVLHRAGYGLASVEHGVPITATTRFPVASVSKAFTAVATARLVEAGVLAWDRTIDHWLPGFPGADEITIRQLVTHRSGIPDTDDLPWFAAGQRLPHELAALVDSLGAAGLEFEPGSQRDYSNGGYTVLAAVLSRATGTSFEEVLDRWVFEPAGMARSGEWTGRSVVEDLASGYMIGPEGRLVPGPIVHPSSKTGAGSAYTTIDDIVAFHRALRDETLIPAPVRDSLFGTIESPFGGQRRFFGGRGPSYTAVVQIFPERNAMVAALGNNYGRLGEEITDGLAGLLFGEWEEERVGTILGRELPFPTRAGSEPTPGPTGRFRHAWGFEFTLEREADRLVYVDPEHRTRSPLIHTGENVWVSPWQWAELRRAPDGSLQWRWLDFPDRTWSVERLEADEERPDPTGGR